MNEMFPGIILQPPSTYAELKSDMFFILYMVYTRICKRFMRFMKFQTKLEALISFA